MSLARNNFVNYCEYSNEFADAERIFSDDSSTFIQVNENICVFPKYLFTGCVECFPRIVHSILCTNVFWLKFWKFLEKLPQFPGKRAPFLTRLHSFEEWRAKIKLKQSVLNDSLHPQILCVKYICVNMHLKRMQLSSS